MCGIDGQLIVLSFEHFYVSLGLMFQACHLFVFFKAFGEQLIDLGIHFLSLLLKVFQLTFKSCIFIIVNLL
jgi:hypothetical protein